MRSEEKQAHLEKAKILSHSEAENLGLQLGALTFGDLEEYMHLIQQILVQLNFQFFFVVVSV